MRSCHEGRWTIILAAGEGTRLRPLTRMLHGEDLPKQFAMIQRGRSLLQSTLERAAHFSPAERTVVVVAADREALAREQAAAYGPIKVVAQPRNLGTGPGLLLPLAQVVAREPNAIVTVLPSDHFVGDEAPFVETVNQAVVEAALYSSIVLVGAVPDHAETEYGWISPSRAGTSTSCAVSRFHEKPTAKVAQRLLRSGALWNTFMMAGRANRFWQLAQTHLPSQVRDFELYQRALQGSRLASVLSEIYWRMEGADFSKDVLERTNCLRVVPLKPCGWSDWGTPRRVLESLRGSAELTALTQRARLFQTYSGGATAYGVA